MTAAEVGTSALVCGFCSVGCSLDVRNGGPGGALTLVPTRDYPVNLGLACPKGWEALSPLRAPDRATVPLLRERGADRLRPVGWDEAISAFVGELRAVQAAHGPDSVAWLGTGQIPTEELAFLGALAKFGMGIVHGDGNTRQCMATSVVAHKEAFGFDAPPYTYADLEESDVIVLVGSNLCIAHPVLWDRVCRNPHHPEVVVIDPRMTETAVAATQHYPIRPKSDLTLLYGLARAVIARGAVDRPFVDAHTNGFDAFAAHVEEFTPDVVSKATGLPADALDLLADTVAGGERVSFWWTMGVNQSHEGVRVAEAIINLALLTGNMGRPGTGANSITGQCNAMGSRLFSNTTNLLGGRDFADPGHRAEVAAVLGIDETLIPGRPSLAYDQIVDGIRAGTIRGLWVIATNSAHSWVDQGDLADVLGRLDFLVVQDMYSNTETAAHADLVLPAAGWGEKEGTFINSERRIGRIRRVAAAPGQALDDFAIFRLIADAWGCGPMFGGWDSPESVFRILVELSRGRPCDVTGIDGYRTLDERGGVQWPFPATDPPAGTERRLFADGRFYHPDGRARFVFGRPRPAPEAVDDRYPFTLLTGRGSSSQWHTQTRTSKSTMLRSLAPERAYVELAPADAERLGVGTGDNVVVSSRRGEMVATAFVTPTVQPGQVFLPMHYPGTNRLTRQTFDPYSRQPSYKSCAVALRRLEGTRR